jgi:hypothetical protein
MSVDFYARGARSETLCDGTVVHPYLALESELNLANTNAKAFLDLLDLDTDEDLYGSVLTGEVTLVEASRAWMKANARFEQLVTKHIREEEQDGNIYSAGLTSRQLRTYLDKFQALIVEARDFDATHIYWC